ncbi:hypothetical protein TNIN_304631 [Trichonephila inaurata madagascariensis]|uniref:Uncharacterized protein n=1 Tax=Trichonephila inaurata madagascariensis TaxID=2747483 RepID=A0A8X6WNV4_9ARAC|nr:hypothetical protein TNIN_304631 [Trichonephila inaurata madagascariensis]
MYNIILLLRACRCHFAAILGDLGDSQFKKPSSVKVAITLTDYYPISRRQLFFLDMNRQLDREAFWAETFISGIPWKRRSILLVSFHGNNLPKK